MGARAGDGCINLDEFIASPHSPPNATESAHELTLLNVYIYIHIHGCLNVYTDLQTHIYIHKLDHI